MSRRELIAACFRFVVAPLLKTNNHDMLGFRLYTDPQEAWEVDTYDDDGDDELDALVHHMEHELFSESCVITWKNGIRRDPPPLFPSLCVPHGGRAIHSVSRLLLLEISVRYPPPQCVRYVIVT